MENLFYKLQPLQQRLDDMQQRLKCIADEVNKLSDDIHDMIEETEKIITADDTLWCRGHTSENFEYRCIHCNQYLGEHNPRQYCGKTHCNSPFRCQMCGKQLRPN